MRKIISFYQNLKSIVDDCFVWRCSIRCQGEISSKVQLIFFLFLFTFSLIFNFICLFVFDMFYLIRKTEIWCGVNNASIAIFELDGSSAVIDKKVKSLQHSSNRSASDCAVTILLSSDSSVYSYPSPGCVLYRWDAAQKQIVNQLDCLKLVPCSESLGSISIDKNLSVGRCQITAATILNENVYIGTSWGCLIVADQISLAPITVFRPFEEEVQYISSVPIDRNHPMPTIITVGKGYRSLINRFTDHDLTGQRNINAKERRTYQTHCILWRAEHWTPF